MKIIGTGSALPKKVVTNDMLTEFFDTSDEWIRTRTGIETRRIMTDESLLDLAITASRNAIEAAGLKAEDLDYIICSNVNNNYVYPSMSCMVQGAIGATCPCFDIRIACAGFVYAMDIAESFLQTGRAHKILVLAAEEPTRFCHWKQRETSVLFGDGAGAAVVTEGGEYLGARMTTISNTEVLFQRNRLEPTPFEVEGVYLDHPMVMQGREVFRMAVESSQKDLDIVMTKAGVTSEQVDYFLLHQANMRIIKAIREQIKQPVEKFPTNIERYGNTSSASIPILLDELSREGKLKQDSILALSAFGAGFVTGAAVLKWNAINY